MKSLKKTLLIPIIALSSLASCTQVENTTNTTECKKCETKTCPEQNCPEPVEEVVYKYVVENDKFLKVEQAHMDILLGSPKYIVASSNDKNATYTYECDNPSVVTISTNGLIVPLVGGKFCNITVKCSNGLSTTIEVYTYSESDYFTFNGATLTGCIDNYAEELVLPTQNGTTAITTVATRAFVNLPKLRRIYIPEGYKTLNDGAFVLPNLEEIYIPGSLTSYGAQPYVRLKKFNVNPNCTFIKSYSNGTLFCTTNGNGASSVRSKVICITSDFDGVVPEEIISDGVTSSVYGSFNNIEGPKNIILPEGFTEIGFASFVGNSTLESVTLPSTITTITGSHFTNCSSLKEFRFNNSKELYDAEEGETAKLTYVKDSGDNIIGVTNGKFTILNEDKNLLNADCTQIVIGVKNFNVHSSINTIGAYAYAGRGLKNKIKLLPNLTVESFAFFNNPEMTSLFLPSNTTIQTNSQITVTYSETSKSGSYNLSTLLGLLSDKNQYIILSIELSKSLFLDNVVFETFSLANKDLVIYSDGEIDSSSKIFYSGYGSSKYKFEVLNSTNEKTSEELFDEI